MFTGIIEEIGTVQSIKEQRNAAQMEIKAKRILEDVQVGDSIAVNGICLTVTNFEQEKFSVDVMPETIKVTNLIDLKVGSTVNLERSMSANGRFGGHFVSGHIDGVGQIIERRPESNAIYYRVKVNPSLSNLMIEKGSIAVDGTSLTIFDVEKDSFLVSIIPHTASETIIGQKREGDRVNIECDMLAKYVHRFTEQHGEKGMTFDWLNQQGILNK
ncbi:riboflavin synthase [Bacillus carboniphilus]|uniref:Riboflavin synthase n=1 Tax=Bacillus carboniphilus TaxID=86663 RepID=A0ABY9JWL5_9BACI|nr:riboflavin synthase [Bacillus carboniphilus]WLR43792.1 riboflavin synthase [Bacillus carboniphilus]